MPEDRESQTPGVRPRPVRVTATQLRVERGWTAKMIRELLGEPDARPQNRSYPSRPPLKLYDLERVEEAERTDTFFELLDQSEARKDSAQKGKDAQRLRILMEVDALDLQIPRMEMKYLAIEAVERYNDWVDDQGADRPYVTLHSHVMDVMRVMVHHLRFTTPGYPEMQQKLLRRTGAREARRRLNERIFQAIARLYPELADECQRQNRGPLDAPAAAPEDDEED